MAMTELEALSQKNEFEIRAAILAILEHKKRIKQELEQEETSVIYRQRLEGVLADIDSQIQQYRFSGLF